MTNQIYLFLFSILRYLLLFISLSGYVILFWKKYKIKIEFLPCLIFTGIILIMYLGGLLNILQIMAYIIFSIGILIFLRILYKKYLDILVIKSILSPGILLFFLACILLIICYHNARLIHYDNFSHWGLIVKQMWLDNRFANASNNLIQFSSYPPGSSVFIYYITLFIGQKENNMLIAQNFLSFSCILCLCAFIKNRKNYYAFLLIVLYAIFSLNYSIGMNTLLVDALLPLMAVANTAIILYYKNHISKAALFSIPVMTATLLIKNSGLIFALFNVIIILILIQKNRKISKDNEIKRMSRREIICIGICIIIPFVFRLLWSQHVKLAFSADTLESAKHSMNIQQYIAMFSDKSNEDIRKILSLFKNKMLDFSTQIFWVLWNFIFLILFFLMKQERKKIWLTFILGNLLYITYQIGLLMMYIFSMPVSESLMLAGFERYNATIITYIFGIGLIVQITLMNITIKNLRNKVWISNFFYLMLIGYGICNINLTKTVLPQKPEPRIKILESVVADLSEVNEHSYAIYSPSGRNDNGYLKYVSRYILYTDRIEILVSLDNELELITALKSNDYLLVLEKDAYIEEVLSKLGENESYSGIYKCENIMNVLFY